jgi:hypothetical protein
MTSRIAVSVMVVGALTATCAHAQDNLAVAASPTGHGPAVSASGSPAPAARDQANLSNAGESHVVNGEVAELTKMLKSTTLTEMRTTYNGSYGASVFFLASELTWYVALFHDKTFWRVLKTPERERATAIYARFVQQTERLSRTEIEQIELTAQRQSLDRMIATAENSASRLRADLDIAREQEAQIAERQRATYDETRILNVEKRAAQLQLGDLRKQLRELRDQMEAGLPAPSDLPGHHAQIERFEIPAKQLRPE